MGILPMCFPAETPLGAIIHRKDPVLAKSPRVHGLEARATPIRNQSTRTPSWAVVVKAMGSALRGA
jgi:hypothetical protein